ncbi:MAG: septal ring lytic transglycosylase RlpA family protein [Pseudomonadota bacterium]
MLFSACSWIGLNLNRPSLSKRVVEYGQPVPKGGGVYKIGKPYNIDGVRYTPKEDRYYNKVGQASWYGAKFHGRYTANREIYDMDALTAAHPTLPIPSYVRVTNLSNGRRLVVRVNDRGPYANDRIIDMSRRSAELLDFKQKGTAKVRVTYIGKAPLNGNDRYERQYLSQQYWFQGRNNRRYSSRSQNRRFARRSRPRRVAQRYDTLTVGSLPRESRYQSPISRNARYAIQTGSFYNYRNAKRRSTQVSRVGRAYIKSFDRDKGTLHKVMLGPFKNRKSAEYTLSQLYSSGMYDAILVKK